MLFFFNLIGNCGDRLAKYKGLRSLWECKSLLLPLHGYITVNRRPYFLRHGWWSRLHRTGARGRECSFRTVNTRRMKMSDRCGIKVLVDPKLLLAVSERWALLSDINLTAWPEMFSELFLLCSCREGREWRRRHTHRSLQPANRSLRNQAQNNKSTCSDTSFIVGS